MGRTSYVHNVNPYLIHKIKKIILKVQYHNNQILIIIDHVSR